MRKKGEIWQRRYQQLIVEQYRAGTPVSEILQLPSLRKIKASEYLVRQILKHNNVETSWQRAKVKEEVWQQDVVDFVLECRSQGKSFTEITEALQEKFPDVDVSRSTIFRIVEEKGSGTGAQVLSDEQEREIANIIVDNYSQGLLVKEIKQLPELRQYRLSDHMVREILKNNGVELTGRKGSLRRWPGHLQRLVVALYKEGLTFDEIKDHNEIAANNPTDYAIRNILKRHGVVTRRPSYLRPISKERYRRYRDNRMGEKEISLIHKHLARFDEGRHLMLERMGLKGLNTAGIDCINDLQRTSLIINAERWQGFFHWGMQFLYDDTLKKQVFDLGVEFCRAVNFLRRTCADGGERAAKAWQRILDDISDMQKMQEELLVTPAIRYKVEHPQKDIS